MASLSLERLQANRLNDYSKFSATKNTKGLDWVKSSNTTGFNLLLNGFHKKDVNHSLNVNFTGPWFSASNLGCNNLMNLIKNIVPERMTVHSVENESELYIVVRKLNYTFHFTINEEEYMNNDPDIHLAVFNKDIKEKSYFNSLTEIDYLINSWVE